MNYDMSKKYSNNKPIFPETMPQYKLVSASEKPSIISEDEPDTLKYHNRRERGFYNYITTFVHGFNDPKKVSVVENFFKEVFDLNEVAMRVDLSTLPLIFNSGHFKTQIETGKTTSDCALTDIPQRKRGSNRLFGTYVNDPMNINNDQSLLDPKRAFVAKDYDDSNASICSNNKFEKYGYLSSMKHLETDETLNRYGNTKIVFNDSVKSRTTVTLGDSLSTTACPTRLNNPKATFIPTNDQDNQPISIYFEIVYYLIQSGKLDSFKDDPKKILNEIKIEIKKFDLDSQSFEPEYFELQIHGDLNWEDIERIEPCYTSSASANLKKVDLPRSLDKEKTNKFLNIMQNSPNYNEFCEKAKLFSPLLDGFSKETKEVYLSEGKDPISLSFLKRKN